MTPLLQVALDVLNIEQAISIASAAIRGGVDIIEAGTPLIHKFGLTGVLPELRKISRGHMIVADLKIADAGYISAKMAFENGANIVTVLCASSDKTILGAIEAAQEYEGKVMADLIVSKDIEKDIEKVMSLGVDFILVHTGLDEQQKGKSALDILKEPSIQIPPDKLAVAGGINPENITHVLKFNPAIIIVGGAIIRSKDPEMETRRLKTIITEYLGQTDKH